VREHIKILGVLNIVMGGLTALVGVVALLAMGSIAGFVAASLSSVSHAEFQDTAVSVPVIAGIGVAIAIFFCLLGLPAILGGWGLLRFRPWARLLTIVLSVLHLFHIPLGTALGVYGLWVLLSPESQAIFANRGAYSASAPVYPPVQPPA